MRVHCGQNFSTFPIERCLEYKSKAANLQCMFHRTNTVSYTHLVKLRICSVRFTEQTRGKEGALRSHSWTLSILPVSYTHLDVYKRQLFKWKVPKPTPT